MSVITYPDGSQLTSTALSKNQIETAFQLLTCQMLGIVATPWTATFNLVAGQSYGLSTSLLNLYGGQVVTCNGLPANTQVASVESIKGEVWFNNPATLTGTETGTVVDPLAFSRVRIGWQQQGQPGFGVNDDIVIVRCTPVDAEYSRGRDITRVPQGDHLLETDSFTRQWKTAWCFYGPNSIDRARAVRSGLARVDSIDFELAALNLYVNPSIAEPLRVPELYQGQWWERVDLNALFNEAVDETLTVNAVASVEVLTYTRKGLISDFVAQLK
jgi:hypothetical protein